MESFAQKALARLYIFQQNGTHYHVSHLKQNWRSNDANMSKEGTKDYSKDAFKDTEDDIKALVETMTSKSLCLASKSRFVQYFLSNNVDMIKEGADKALRKNRYFLKTV